MFFQKKTERIPNDIDILYKNSNLTNDQKIILWYKLIKNFKIKEKIIDTFVQKKYLIEVNNSIFCLETLIPKKINDIFIHKSKKYNGLFFTNEIYYVTSKITQLLSIFKKDLTDKENLIKFNDLKNDLLYLFKNNNDLKNIDYSNNVLTNLNDSLYFDFCSSIIYYPISYLEYKKYLSILCNDKKDKDFIKIIFLIFKNFFKNKHFTDAVFERHKFHSIINEWIITLNAIIFDNIYFVKNKGLTIMFKNKKDYLLSIKELFFKLNRQYNLKKDNLNLHNIVYFDESNSTFNIDLFMLYKQINKEKHYEKFRIN
ncbi:hypothetical protein MALL_0372 [Mycoplasmopsis alligatoris A21JP2]|uniref:Uncharacterized protein n=2 Tax=Mycoplasmopsis alligatoris TaxID=47687 RepID=D4XWQ6_9BACT|nr:hypothetical protein MALL_0372 [Mycoplasmopsis alligatoris A21JP2]